MRGASKADTEYKLRGGAARVWLVAALALMLSLGGCSAAINRLGGGAAEAEIQTGTQITLPLQDAAGDSGAILPTPTPEVTASSAVSETITFAVPVANQHSPAEAMPQIIQLEGPLTQRSAEVSGLAWLGNRLVIMPQFTDFASAGEHRWYTLDKATIAAWLRADDPAPLSPGILPVTTNGVQDMIAGYEGLEAIAFDQAGKVFVTAEATDNGLTAAWLMSGTVATDGSSVTLHPESMVWIEPQSRDLNHSEESLVLTSGGLFTIYEGNGVNVNTEPKPLAHSFTRNLSPRNAYTFPNIEYRITDATALDGNRRFWAINYFFPNDTALAYENDPIVAQYGAGPTHANLPQVERLLEFALQGNAIVRTNTPPIQLHLSLISRNWEGIVRFQDGDDLDGFLIMTDQFPDTILAYVPKP